ncbi:MAG TPA: PAS domain S-box protein [Candidatus Bathyarchaeia archaeon]|nr:PAS domain S-box protein [Candidatus Bathyarchaeia archaeon]
MNESIAAHDHLHRKPMMRESVEKEQLYQALFDSHPDAVFAMDLYGTILHANPQCELLTGYPAEEWEGHSFQLLIISEERENANRFFQRAADGETVTYETTFLHKTGRYLTILMKNFPLITDGHVVGVYGMATALAEDEKYQLITENTLDMIAKISLEGKCLYISPACQSVLGYEPRELVGKFVCQYFHPEDRIHVQLQELRASFLAKESYTLTCRLRTKRGTYTWFEILGKPVLDPRTGQIQEIIAVARDITERMKTQELLQNSEKLTLVGQLAAGIAHEIRNPLTALKGFLQLMQSSNEQKQEYFSIMSSELTRIELIVSELLVLAKPQTSTFQESDLHTLINHVVTLIDTEAIIKNVQITVEVDDNVQPIRCDENQLKQAFLNFLKNGIEAMPDGGTILIKIWKDTDRIIIQFIDSGCGIPEEMIRRLGEPFFTTKDSGTGLGFMVSRKIIENHQGSIRLTSQPNQGTTVEVALPL